MSGDRWAAVALVVGCLVLVGSNLVARRLPQRHLLALIGAWLGIFAVAALIAQWII